MQKKEWGYTDDGVPKLGQAIGNLLSMALYFLFVCIIMSLILPFSFYAWCRGDGFVSPLNEYDDYD